MADSGEGVGFLGRGSKPHPHQLRDLRKRYKLTQWGREQSSRKWFWYIFELKTE